MNLTQEERDILDGKEGAVFKKVMQTLVLYGEALEAEKFADIEGGGHFSIPFALSGVGPRLEMLDELAEAGIKTTYPFTLDPCPEAYMNNPLCAREAVITNSNKLRAFTPARLLLDEDLVEALVSGEIRKTS